MRCLTIPGSETIPKHPAQANRPDCCKSIPWMKPPSHPLAAKSAPLISAAAPGSLLSCSCRLLARFSKVARTLLRLLVWTGLSGFASVECAAVGPAEFVFRLPSASQNPFARDVWAEVTTPSGKTLRLPAFYVGGDNYAIRARASEAGEYQIGRITEKVGDHDSVPEAKLVSPRVLRIESAQALPPVGLDPVDPGRFVLRGRGEGYAPVGANLAWAGEEPVGFYERTLPQFAAAGLNWTRIWMAHWDGLNLDWLPENFGDSPPPGRLDLRVARDWDRIVAGAENAGVYFQFVLQHHGQFSTAVNANWAANPWNAAHPQGFLQTPADFFTSPRAMEITRMKYRYIVARWGYSPAVLAWELFNEVHWVDPIHLAHEEKTVAAWHSMMADYLRSVDVYGHLVTTSTENLRSPIFARMDYFQPHLYPYAILSGPLTFSAPFEKLNRPVFYGETGDDHAPLNDGQKNSGIAIVPPVWASLFGPGHYPAQPWVGEKIVRVGRLGELGAVARFLAGTRLGLRAGLKPFSPRVECAEQVPFVIEPSHDWQKRPAPDFTLPLDGRVPVEVADIPRIYVGSPQSLAEGFPGRATYHLDFPRATTLRARVTGMGGNGTAIRLSAGGKILAGKAWAAGAPDAPRWDNPFELTFQVPAGPQTLVVENPGAEDWFQLDQIATDLPVPVLAAIGKRSEDFLAVWLWHRTGVFALASPAPVGGTLLLDDVAAGKWTVTWWDTIKGIPAPPQVIEHGGGLLRLSIPAFSRHVAVALTR